MKRITILTLFPSFFDSPFSMGVIDGAKEKGALEIDIVNIRDYSADRHAKCDDYPYGGGPGMLMSASPFVNYYARNPRRRNAHTILFAPAGTPLTQAKAKTLSEMDDLAFICGHYEGVDDRVRALYVDEVVSVGDYVLSGGEIPALLLTDAIARYLGALGNECSAVNDTFEEGSEGLLEYAQYTRPTNVEGRRVPEWLVQGNHKEIARLRRNNALFATFAVRPDMFANARLSETDIQELFRRLIAERATRLKHKE